MTTRYIECDIVCNGGIVNRGMINIAYIIYAEKFDDLTLFHMRNGEGIYVKHDYNTVLAEMKKGWNASYDFVTLPREERNERANKIDRKDGSVGLSGGEGEGSASHYTEAER